MQVTMKPLIIPLGKTLGNLQYEMYAECCAGGFSTIFYVDEKNDRIDVVDISYPVLTNLFAVAQLMDATNPSNYDEIENLN